MFGPGELQWVLLALIARQPRHGYELIKDIEDRFGGQYTPSPGSVYPTLTLLEEQGLVDSSAEGGGARRLYTVTDAGRAELEARRDEVDGAMARMDLAARAIAGRSLPDPVREAVHTLRHALALHRGEWTDAEARRVRDVLEEAARSILIGGGSGTGGSGSGSSGGSSGGQPS